MIELDVERFVQAEALPRGFVVGGGCVLAEQRGERVANIAEHQERYERHNEHDDDRLREPPCDKGEHGAPSDNEPPRDSSARRFGLTGFTGT